MRCVSGKSDIYSRHVAQKNYESLAIMFSKWLCYQCTLYNYHRANKKLLVKHEFVGNANMTTDTFMCVVCREKGS